MTDLFYMMNESQIKPEEDSRGPNWLDRMHEFFQWSVVAPKAYTPYGKTMPDKSLAELIDNKDALLRKIKLKGLFGGDELVELVGINPSTSANIKIESNHPNIAVLTRMDFHHYFLRNGIYEWLLHELDKVQDSYKEEMDCRKDPGKRSTPDIEVL